MDLAGGGVCMHTRTGEEESLGENTVILIKVIAVWQGNNINF